MGARTIVKLESCPDVCVYLHSGYPNDVEGIVEKTKEYARNPGDDPSYCFARLIEQCIEFAGANKDYGIGVGLTVDLLPAATYVVEIDDNWSVKVLY